MQANNLHINTLVAQSCFAYREQASANLRAGSKLNQDLEKLNQICQQEAISKSADIEAISDLLFDFLPKALTKLIDDITNLLGFGLEVRAKVPEQCFEFFQDTLNRDYEFVQQIGKAARELKFSNGRSDKLHIVGSINTGKIIQDKRTQQGNFDIFFPNFPKGRELDFDSVKKSFTKLSKVFTQFDFDFEETLNSLKRGFGNQLGDTSQIS